MIATPKEIQFYQQDHIFQVLKSSIWIHHFVQIISIMQLQFYKFLWSFYVSKQSLMLQWRHQFQLEELNMMISNTTIIITTKIVKVSFSPFFHRPNRFSHDDIQITTLYPNETFTEKSFCFSLSKSLPEHDWTYTQKYSKWVCRTVDPTFSPLSFFYFYYLFFVIFYILRSCIRRSVERVVVFVHPDTVRRKLWPVCGRWRLCHADCYLIVSLPTMNKSPSVTPKGFATYSWLSLKYMLRFIHNKSESF